MNRTIDWEAHRQFIIDNYDNMSRDELSRAVGCSIDTFALRMRKWNMPKKKQVRPKEYHNVDILNVGSSCAFDNKLGDYQAALTKEKEILSKLHKGSCLRLGKDKVGEVASITGKIIIIRFKNYAESFTLFELREMMMCKKVRIEA